MFLATSDASVINGRCQGFFTISLAYQRSTATAHTSWAFIGIKTLQKRPFWIAGEENEETPQSLLVHYELLLSEFASTHGVVSCSLVISGP